MPKTDKMTETNDSPVSPYLQNLLDCEKLTHPVDSNEEDFEFPEVWCLCPTYGRFPDRMDLLDEAVQSFHQQDYPNKHLLILNDCAGQTYRCHVPNVHVINQDDRYPTLGVKYNAMVEEAYNQGSEAYTHLWLCPWEDDDISLPWRISMSVSRLLHQKTTFKETHGEDHLQNWGYWNPKRFWFWQNAVEKLTYDHPMGYGHNCSIYTYDLWSEVSGYDETLSGPQDANMDSRLRKALGDPQTLIGVADGHTGDPMGPSLHVEDWFYIYRWGVHERHLSSREDTQAFYDDIGREMHREGEVTILPAYTRPWLDMVWEKTPKPPEPEKWINYPLMTWKN